MTKFEQRVARGAKLLDKIQPDWEHKIDKDYLLMVSPQDCILGQLYGDYTEGLKKNKILFPYRYGFNLSWWARGRMSNNMYMQYRALKRAWIEEINERLAESGPRSTTA